MSTILLFGSTLGLVGAFVAVITVVAREHARTAARYRAACKAVHSEFANCSPRASQVADWIHAAGDDRSTATIQELGVSLTATPAEHPRSWLAPFGRSQPERRAKRQRGHVYLPLAHNLALVVSGAAVALALLCCDDGPSTLAADQTVQDDVLAVESAHAAASAQASSNVVRPVESAVVAALQPLPLPLHATGSVR